MPKNITFSDSEPLTVVQMNSLLQDGQISQAKGASTTDLMSQNAITTAIRNSVTDIAVTPRPEFGNASTLEGVLTYIAGVFAGNNTTAKIKTRILDLVD